MTDAAPLRVLFLCTTNSARSQIAEALLSKKGGRRFIVASAGPAPAARVHAGAVRALANLGIDWSGRHTKGLNDVANQEWDFIIATSDPVKERCPALPGQPLYARWGVPDPASAGDSSIDDPFMMTAHLLMWRIDLMLAIRPEVLERTALDQSDYVTRRERMSRVDSARVDSAPTAAAP